MTTEACTVVSVVVRKATGIFTVEGTSSTRRISEPTCVGVRISAKSPRFTGWALRRNTAR